jgi:hypothetical protein
MRDEDEKNASVETVRQEEKTLGEIEAAHEKGPGGNRGLFASAPDGIEPGKGRSRSARLDIAVLVVAQE